jgi:polar amino acid transport system substrate-binding protein
MMRARSIVPCLLLLLVAAGCGERDGPGASRMVREDGGTAHAGAGKGGEPTDLWEASVIRKVAERGTLVVAMEPGFLPFEYVDDQDRLVGFDVDLARLLGEALKVRVEFVQVAWDSIIPTLLTGKCDLIISGMTATPERALSVSYTDPYFHTVTCLLVSKKRAGDVKGIEDLDRAGRVVVVKAGTTGDFAAQKRCPKARIVRVGKEVDAAQEVVHGRADAFLYDLWSIRNHHRLNPDATFVVAEPVTREPYGIACRKGDPETVAWLNLALRTFRLDGRLKELYDKHGLEDVR